MWELIHIGRPEMLKGHGEVVRSRSSFASQSCGPYVRFLYQRGFLILLLYVFLLQVENLSHVLMFYRDELDRMHANHFICQLYIVKVLHDNPILDQERDM